jgi:hypothetical protein
MPRWSTPGTPSPRPPSCRRGSDRRRAVVGGDLRVGRPPLFYRRPSSGFAPDWLWSADENPTGHAVVDVVPGIRDGTGALAARRVVGRGGPGHTGAGALFRYRHP